MRNPLRRNKPQPAAPPPPRLRWHLVPPTEDQLAAALAFIGCRHDRALFYMPEYIATGVRHCDVTLVYEDFERWGLWDPTAIVRANDEMDVCRALQAG